MLTALIVKLYKGLVELMLWVFIVAGGIAVSRMDLFVDVAVNGGWFVDKQVVGFAAGALAAFFAGAIIFGAVLILIEVQKSLRRIEARLERNAYIEKEPTLVAPPNPADSSAESIHQRSSKSRQKRKSDDMPSDKPVQDKGGLTGHHGNGT